MKRSYLYPLLIACALLLSAQAMAQGSAPPVKTAHGLVATRPNGAMLRPHAGHSLGLPGHPALAPTHHAPPATGSQRGSAPPNNECTGALPLDVVALADCGTLDVTGDNSQATLSTDPMTCDESNAGFQDVWYSFNSGTHTQVQAAIGMIRMADCVLEAQEGCGGNIVGCTIGTVLILAVNPNTDYVLRVASNTDFGNGGAFTICVSSVSDSPPPPNDEICDVVPQALVVGNSLTWNGTMAGATDQEGLGVNTVWEAFTLDECADVTFNFCGSSSQWITSSFTLVTGDCDDPDNWDMFNASTSLTDCGDGTLLTTAYGLQAGTYYVVIYAEPTDTYTAEVSAATCAPPPANDHCGDVVPEALPIGGSLTFTGHVSSATADGDYGPDFPGDQTVHTVWHAFTTTECANITVSYCGMEHPYSSAWIFLSTSCPVGADFIPGSFDSEQCADGNMTVMFWDLPAGTYYLPLGDQGGYDWPYTVEVRATACGPYCAAWALDAAPYFEKISRVSFAGIDRSSSSGVGYESFLQDTAHVVRGGSYPITVELSHGYYGDQVLAWIDSNGDDVFQAEEQVLATALSAGPYTGTITIPADAAIGNTRMRLRMHDAGHPNWANAAPCGMADYGQVEDYTVLIDVGSGVRETVQDRFAAMPNPATDQLALTFVQGARPLQVIMNDATGRTVLNESVATGNGPVLMDLGGMERGLYLVQVRFADGTQAVERVVKE